MIPKFRGRRKLNGDWVYGSYIYVGNDWCQMLPEGVEWEDRDMRWNRVITETVGQYIGLTDKHQKEIYDGDFLSDDKRRIWRVFRSDSHAGFRHEWVNEPKKQFDGRIGKMSTGCQKYLMDMMEVIGNEFEHSHILNK